MEVISVVMNHREIGERISRLRRRCDMTQDELGELAEINGKHISRIESGHVLPSIDSVMKLCNVLEVTPDYLLLGVKKIDNATINRIVEELRLSSDKQQNLVYEFINLLINEDY
jgi:transcriptional regulator with XRE-family HTH domain